MQTVFKKIIIIGNSGSGKSFLAQKLSTRFNFPVVHLDKLFWTSEACIEKRSKEVVYQEIADLSQSSEWIVEGVFGDLASLCMTQADALIFLNLPWKNCQEALINRGAQNASEKSFQELINWASQYDLRKTMSSLEGHQKIYNQFSGNKFEFKTRREIENWLAQLSQK